MQVSERRGDGYVNLALLTDGLRAEREQGITIDVAYRYFQTARRKFIIADTPGHEQYTRNMVTGASTADVSIVLVDARKGVSRADAPPRLHRRAAAHPAPRGVREQDGPGRLRRSGVRDHRRRPDELGRTAGYPRHQLHPHLGPAGRQRRRPFPEHGLVRRWPAPVSPRARGHRPGPQPGRRALSRPARHPPDERRAPRLPRLCRTGGRRRAASRRRRRRAAGRPAHHDRGHRHLRRASRGRLSHHVGDRAAGRRSSTCRAAT